MLHRLWVHLYPLVISMAIFLFSRIDMYEDGWQKIYLATMFTHLAHKYKIYVRSYAATNAQRTDRQLDKSIKMWQSTAKVEACPPPRGALQTTVVLLREDNIPKAFSVGKQHFFPLLRKVPCVGHDTLPMSLQGNRNRYHRTTTVARPTTTVTVATLVCEDFSSLWDTAYRRKKKIIILFYFIN